MCRIQASAFQMKISLFTINYLEDNFFENVDIIPNSKFERVVSQLFQSYR